jgi:pantoate--beta-alanine ligase
MEIITTKADIRAFTHKIKAQGSTICLVPTMGFFHDGHLDLMKRAAKLADVVLVSLFVNPTQFSPDEDLSRYPRDFKEDCRKAESVGVHGLFYPDAAEVYPKPCLTTVTVPSLSHQLCGKSRPTHFDGVATVVAKLLNICQPDVAIFGEKDFQQLAVIKQFVYDLDIPVKIVSLPIVREADGLAMSSRNSYLSPEERKQALCLSSGLQLGRTAAVAGKTSSFIINEITAFIEKHPKAVVDYITIVNQYTLDRCEQVDEQSILTMAVKIGKTRLIDNGFLLIGE